MSHSGMSPLYYSRSLSGHRASYLDFVLSTFGGRRGSARQLLLWRGPVLFLMIEDSFLLYVLVSIWRALLGRRTAGLLFRPGPAVSGASWRLRFKRLLLRGIRRLPYVSTISIVPATLDPRIYQVADEWIHDFQLWDLSDTHFRMFDELRAGSNRTTSQEAHAIFRLGRAHASGRRLLVALGAQNRAKGTPYLAMHISALKKLGWTVLVAGRFHEGAAMARTQIEEMGGYVLDRHLTDEEMLGAYAAADAVWCFYDPQYDQASGILGRSFQLGVPVVVRKGSYSEKFCETERFSHASIGINEGFIGQNQLDRLTHRASNSHRLAEASRLRLLRALGLSTGQENGGQA